MNRAPHDPPRFDDCWFGPREATLLTDRYELGMVQAYVAAGIHALPATFSLFVRRLPASRNTLLAAGLDDVLRYLEELRFADSDLDYLREQGFSEQLTNYLREFRFEGDVRALPEGTPFFAEEPILEVHAPLGQAQLIETYLMGQVHLQTTLASKALRVAHAARGRPVLDFGARRTHGAEAALKAARAFYIAGVAATSNVLAGRTYGVPIAGTMAHSFVQAYDDELDAFRAFTREFPETILLVDTYDTLRGVRRVVELAEELGPDFRVRGVRLDSGDLGALARDARRILDGAGLQHLRIYASGGLDEHQIDDLIEGGAPIDGFGVGTSMGVSADVPDLDLAYKLTECAGLGRVKLSSGKRTLPGRKQVFRHAPASDEAYDVITRADEQRGGTPLLQPVMTAGQRTPAGRDTLDGARDRAARALEALPARVQALDAADPPFDVRISDALNRHHREVIERVQRDSSA